MSKVQTRFPVVDELGPVPSGVERFVHHARPLEPLELGRVERRRLAGMVAAILATPTTAEDDSVVAAVVHLAGGREATVVCGHDPEGRFWATRYEEGQPTAEVNLSYVYLPNPVGVAPFEATWYGVIASASSASGLAQATLGSVVIGRHDWPVTSDLGLEMLATAVSDALAALDHADPILVGAIAAWWLRRKGRGVLRVSLGLRYYPRD